MVRAHAVNRRIIFSVRLNCNRLLRSCRYSLNFSIRLARLSMFLSVLNMLNRKKHREALWHTAVDRNLTPPMCCIAICGCGAVDCVCGHEAYRCVVLKVYSFTSRRSSASSAISFFDNSTLWRSQKSFTFDVIFLRVSAPDSGAASSPIAAPASAPPRNAPM